MSFSHVQLWLHKKVVCGFWRTPLLCCLAIGFLTTPILVGLTEQARAATNSASDFNIQVSPSPLVVKLPPGRTQTAIITVRNFSNHAETLYPHLGSFTIDKNSHNVQLQESAPSELKNWVSFKESSLTIPAGGTQNLSVVFSTPTNVGFSYSAAITLARQGSTADSQGVNLRGTVAVFCLINIDRPDAKRQLSISSLASDKEQYQYLPAAFKLTISNNGNVIDQPKGTLFIQRAFNDTKPIASIRLNPGSNYVLPGTSREFTAEWGDGFPVYIKRDSGKPRLSWDWKRVHQLRFGKYVAKAVLVYNDGQRDIPVVAAKTFWVIPWTLLLVILLVCVILIMGIASWGRLIFKGTKKVRKYASRHR